MGRSALLAAAVAVLAAVGCTRGNDAYCCTDPVLCADVGGVLDDCRAGTICDDQGALEGVPHTCVNDPAAVTCEGPDDCSAPTPACVGRICVPCAADTDCPDPAAARCALDTNRCVGCDGGGQCSRFGSETCDDGICVECAATADPTESGECDPLEPICIAPGMCRGCADHRECASGACDPSGACAVAADIAYVDAANTDGSISCTVADPCPKVADGVATGRGFVVITAGAYSEVLALDRAVTLIGYGATVTAALNPGNAIDVTGATADVALFGLTLTSSDTGIECIGTAGGATRISLTEVTISNHSDEGINAFRCDVIVRRSRITSNAGGGIDLDESGFDIVSSIIDDNGNATAYGGIRVAAPRALARLSFNTIADNRSSTTSAPTVPGIRCESLTSVTFDSNLVSGNLGGVGNVPVSGQPGCAYSYSLFHPVAVVGTENVAGDPAFTGTAYRITEASPARDQGMPGSAVVDDIDGDARPSDLPDIGADEYVAP